MLKAWGIFTERVERWIIEYKDSCWVFDGKECGYFLLVIWHNCLSGKLKPGCEGKRKWCPFPWMFELKIFLSRKCGKKGTEILKLLLGLRLGFCSLEIHREGWQLSRVQWWFSPWWHVYCQISPTSQTSSRLSSVLEMFRDRGTGRMADGYCIAPSSIASDCEQGEPEITVNSRH